MKTAAVSTTNTASQQPGPDRRSDSLRVKHFAILPKMTNPRNQYKFTHGFLDTTGYDCYTFSRYGGIAKW